MTESEYWDGDNYLPKAFHEAFIMREKRNNRDMWLQGKYFLDAMATIMNNAFGAKGAKKDQYPEKPYRIYKPTEEELAEEQREANEKMQAALQSMIAEQKRKKNK